jgi:uncharacterized membrane protein YvbJ
MKCEKCGSENRENAVLCRKCGRSLTVQVPEQNMDYSYSWQPTLFTVILFVLIMIIGKYFAK